MGSELEHISADTAARLETHAAKIDLYDSGMETTWRGFSVFFYLCGRELRAAKETISHGNARDGEGFMAWVKGRFKRFSHQTAVNRMRFAESIDLKFQTVVNFKRNLLLLEENPKHEQAGEVVEKAVHDVMNGKSITAFLREEGKVRKPDKPGWRPPAKAVEEWLKKHHPDLTGTKFGELSKEVQSAFKKYWKRAEKGLSKEMLSQAYRARMEETFDRVSSELAEKIGIKALDGWEGDEEAKKFFGSYSRLLKDYAAFLDKLHWPISPKTPKNEK
jgi:hypothetical protein